MCTRARGRCFYIFVHFSSSCGWLFCFKPRLFCQDFQFWALQDEMKDQRDQANAVTYGCMINACVKCSQTDTRCVKAKAAPPGRFRKDQNHCGSFAFFLFTVSVSVLTANGWFCWSILSFSRKLLLLIFLGYIPHHGRVCKARLRKRPYKSSVICRRDISSATPSSTPPWPKRRDVGFWGWNIAAPKDGQASPSRQKGWPMPTEPATVFMAGSRAMGTKRTWVLRSCCFERWETKVHRPCVFLTFWCAVVLITI